MNTKQKMMTRIINEYFFNGRLPEKLWLDDKDIHRDEDNLLVTMTDLGYLSYHKLTTLLYDLAELTDCLKEVNEIVDTLDCIVNNEEG